MTSVQVLMALAMASGTAAVLLLVRHLQIVSLNARIAKTLVGPPTRPAPVQGAAGWLASIGARYRRFYSAQSLEQLRTLVQASGFNPHRALSIWIGVKVLSAVSFPLAALFIAEFSGMATRSMVGFVLMGVAVGVMAPRLILSVLKRNFTAAVKKGTPDAIDLLVVCSEAGMGLESAVERVANEMDRSNSAMARVLYTLLDDLRVLPNRREAFDKFGATTEGLRRFATMLNQSMQYGTPLSQALRAIAEELRRDAIIKLEEKAHKLGPKLIIPMVMFLLPAMFVIIGGSSFLRLMRTFNPNY